VEGGDVWVFGGVNADAAVGQVEHQAANRDVGHAEAVTHQKFALAKFALEISEGFEQIVFGDVLQLFLAAGPEMIIGCMSPDSPPLGRLRDSILAFSQALQEDAQMAMR
jgi:hypothetical protein